jgi:hypothetical protein
MDDLKSFLEATPKSKWKLRVRNNQEWCRFLQEIFPFTSDLSEHLYLFAHDMQTRPICPVDDCNTPVNWLDTHYTTTCGRICREKYKKQKGINEATLQKYKATCLEKYGVENASRSAQIQDKRAQTMMKKYGAGLSEKGKEAARQRASNLNTKGRETIRLKYGVDNPSQVPGVQLKKEQTLLQRYGVRHPSQIPSLLESKTQQRCERWIANFPSIEILEYIEPGPLNLLRPHSNRRVKFKCVTCDLEDTLASETLKYRQREFGTPCSKCCNLIPYRSKQEQEIAEFLQQHHVQLCINTRDVISPLELDIYIADHKLAIEYCGLYWHSENNGKDRDYHVNKFNLCQQQGIRLITIFEDEWVHHKDICKSRLLNCLGLSHEKIYARKTVVREISGKQANEFCNNNHIQGAGRTQRAFGLFAQEELVSVMTFSLPNIAKGSRGESAGILELNRFCSKLQTNVLGGANKLFAYATSQLPATSIFTYCDLRWNTGNVYQTMGFNYSSTTLPNYWYLDFNKAQRIHRFNLRKNKDDNPALTEWENRQEQGWNRIWDCGNTKWIWMKKAEL